jgi:ribosomal protein L19
MAVANAKNKPGFAVYRGLPSVRSKPATKDPLPAWQDKQLTLLDPTGARTRLFDRTKPDSAKVGDVLRVATKTGEPFAGVCISIRRNGVDSAILLRGQMFKVGVELWYKIYSPHVVGIDIIWRRPKRARRARLFYMRKPEHDMGSVDDLVFAWKKERAALRGKKGQKGNQPLGTRF